MAGIFDFLDAAVPYGGGLLGRNFSFSFDPTQLGRTLNTIQGLNDDPVKTLAGLLQQATPPSAINQRPLGAPALPAPVNVAALPQGGQDIPQTQQPQLTPQESIPQAARPTQYQAPQQPQQQNNPLNSIGEFFGNLAANASPTWYGIRQSERSQAASAQALYQALAPRIGAERAAAVAQAAGQNHKLAEIILPQALGLNPPKSTDEAIARALYNQGQQGGSGINIQDAFKVVEQLKRAESRGTSAGQAEGTQTANAQMDLPGTVATAQEALRVAESLRNHPGRNNPFFWHSKSSGYLPDAAIPGNTDAFDANQRLKQLTAGAFASAYAALRGGGQISNVEGTKMTESLNRMNRASSKEEFDSSLNDFMGILRLGVDRAAQKAGAQAPYGFKGNTGQGTTSSGVKWSVQ